MSTEQYESAIALVKKAHDRHDPNGPIPETMVARAEAKLEIVFPPDYRRFLLEFGSGYLGDQAMYGLVPAPDFEGFPNIVWLTLKRRRLFELPKHLLPISDDGFGSEYLMDLRDGCDPPVRLWPGGLPFEDAAEKEYPSFGHFLLDVAEHMAN